MNAPQVNVNDVITALKNQRNSAQDEAAMLQAFVWKLEAEIASLKQKPKEEKKP